VEADEKKYLAELLVASQKGDKVAYAQLLELLYPLVRKMVAVRTQHDKDEIVQEVLIAIHRARHTFQPGREILPWLMAIVQFRVHDAKRRYWRDKNRKEFAQETLSKETVQDKAIETSVRDSITALSHNQKRAVLMTKIQGYSIEETATALGVSVASVKNHISRAYQNMRKLLTEARDES
jgi:RNA polymerase sigma factor (sigma-70 family)